MVTIEELSAHSLHHFSSAATYRFLNLRSPSQFPVFYPVVQSYLVGGTGRERMGLGGFFKTP